MINKDSGFTLETDFQVTKWYVLEGERGKWTY
jgi:hypothetical protein